LSEQTVVVYLTHVGHRGVEAIQPVVTREVVALLGHPLVEGVVRQVVANQLEGEVRVVLVVVLRVAGEGRRGGRLVLHRLRLRGGGVLRRGGGGRKEDEEEGQGGWGVTSTPPPRRAPQHRHVRFD